MAGCSIEVQSWPKRALRKVNAGARSGTRERPSQVVLSLSARGKRKGFRTTFKWRMLKFNAGEVD